MEGLAGMVSEGRQAKQHHHVAFAKTYFRGAFRTFNAAAALFRMEQLVEEAEEMAALLRDHPLNRFPVTLPQFAGYYLVGFVTCLEWHARSRLADLLAHAPDRTTADDLKAVTEGGKLREMVASRLTVPELVGASANVSSLREYVAVFDRVFDAITPEGLGVRASHAIKAGDVPGEPSDWVELERLYETRHRMVHEISHEQIGHYALRNTVHVEEAIRLGKRVQGCMREIERVVTTHASGDFPNLLRPDGYPVYEAERLRADVEAAEVRLAALDPARSEEADDQGLDPGLVRHAVEAGRRHVEAELVWLGKFHPAGWRYHNPADDLEVNLLRGRLAYLREVEEVLRTT